MKKICVLGLGYIGLPTAAILADNAYSVIGVDIEPQVLEDLKQGKSHIEEPDLDNILKKVVDDNSLRFSLRPEPADAFIIAVPTPHKTDKTCDLSCVMKAVISIQPYLVRGNIVIIESTIPPLTCESIIKPVLESAGFIVGKDIYLAHCPERVLPGNIISEMIYNNRLIGGCTEECSRVAAEIYKSFVKGEILLTDAGTAEMTKLVENTFRDINIAFANELTKICNYIKIDVHEVIKLANKHPRVNILNPGPGVGGHCLAVDPYFIIEKAPSLTGLIAEAREINCSMPEYIVEKAKKIMAGSHAEAKIAIFGIAYKGNVSDRRESPALKIIELLATEGFDTAIYDPCVAGYGGKMNLDRVVRDADLLLILTDHDEFKYIDYKNLIGKMRKPCIFDTRNIVNTEKLMDYGIQVYNLGNVL